MNRKRWLEIGAVVALLLALAAVGAGFYRQHRLNEALATALDDALTQAMRPGVAVHSREYAEVRALLERGASERVRGRQTCVTPLMCASAVGDVATQRQLIARGADVNAKDSVQWTALHLAAYTDHTESVRVLLVAGAEVDAKDSVGQTALMWAADDPDGGAARELLAHGADPNSSDADGWTALANAAWNDRAETVRLLLAMGADVNVQDVPGHTPLMEASKHGSTAAVIQLLARGANPNLKDARGETALSRAVESEYASIGRLLKKAGAKE